MTSNYESGCKIWLNEPGNGYRNLDIFGQIDVETSPRAGGAYSIGREAILAIRDNYLSDLEKARLTTTLIDQRRQGFRFPLVNGALLERVKGSRPLPVHERAYRLLSFMAEQTENIGDRFRIPFGDPSALAYSESTKGHEVYFLLDYLKQAGWIDGNFLANASFEGVLTVEGYSHIAEANSNVDSLQAFVAMWFEESMYEIYDQGIAPAIRQAGYEPYVVGRDDYIGDVTDKIISEIRRSKFLVADFTHGGKGVRGGVYYEAGFAHGLNKPVIPTCKKERVDNDPRYLHFDTSHLNHILWTDAADLREKLTNRILAVLDKGPNKQQS